MCIALLDALGVQYVVIALYQWFDWGTDILFLDAEIYGSEFREHPSFAATRTAAIFFDVTGFIALVWALRRKAIFQLRIRKEIFEDPNAPGLCALLREFSMLDAAEAQVHATELAGHVRA